MKYIRTKDGIYELMFPNEEQQMSFDHKTIEPAYYTTKNEWIAKKDVIAQADTITELCDEFVVKDITDKYAYVTKEKPDTLYFNCDIYGAIWTDKGLIYVAKMNDKGELELL